MPETILSAAGFFAIIIFYAVGAAGSLLLGAHDRPANFWGNCCAIAGSLLGLIFSGAVFLTGTMPVFRLPSSFPLLSPSFRIDYLAAFFLFMISLIALVCSIYALGYVRHYYGKYRIGNLGFFYNVFIAGMVMVAAADNALFFLIAWEIMSLASYFLVIFERQEEKSIKAGTLYFIMTHLGTAFIILSFLLLYRATGSFDFGAMRAGMAGGAPLLKNAIFVWALIGFGAKAGIIPLHIWLPSAHPAAPSPVSALMSGVMIKTGIYMLVRICWDILPGPPPLWWGLVLLCIGAVSALLGVLYALSEHDLKKLLAYHSIENVGIIFLGLGSSLVFLSGGRGVPAVFSLVAALYHTLNHATFKALLFLGAGSVIAGTHTRNIEEYGGLIRGMPQTAFFFLIGSMAISALPPFNGFFSEWMTFQSLFQGLTAFNVTTKVIFILSVGALAFTGGLAAACFVKVFGTTFLARPRSAEAEHAQEPGLFLRASMAVLALLTLLLGFFAGPLSRLLAGIVAHLANFPSGGTPPVGAFDLLSVRTEMGRVSLPVLGAMIVVVTALLGLVAAMLARGRDVRIGATWDCGADLGPRREITATGFSRSIITVFRGVLKPTKQTETEYHDARLRYFPKSGTVTMGMQDVYTAYFYKPLQELTIRLAEEIKKIQGGNVNVYILYIFITLMGLLLMLVI